MAQRWRRLLPGLWAGFLLCIAAVAAPALFATLVPADAGRVVSRIFVQEAWLSLALAFVLLMLERASSKAPGLAAVPSALGNPRLLWGTIACTVIGYLVAQVLMPAARAGQGMFSFGQLHLISTLLFGVKTLLVLLLAWRAARADPAVSPIREGLGPS